MSKTEFNEVCMTHYRDEEKGEDCFALSHTVDNKDWKNFATRVENALKINHAGGLYRSTRIWKCKFMDDDRALRACESVMEVCSDYNVRGFKSDFFDIVYYDCDGEKKEASDIDKFYSKELFIVGMQRHWDDARKEIIELSRKLVDIQKQMEIRIDELEALSVPLELYSPDGGWLEEVNKWRKK